MILGSSRNSSSEKVEIRVGLTVAEIKPRSALRVFLSYASPTKEFVRSKMDRFSRPSSMSASMFRAKRSIFVTLSSPNPSTVRPKKSGSFTTSKSGLSLYSQFLCHIKTCDKPRRQHILCIGGHTYRTQQSGRAYSIARLHLFPPVRMPVIRTDAVPVPE